eukprot:787492-Rhodomonas_salina.2
MTGSSGSKSPCSTNCKSCLFCTCSMRKTRGQTSSADQPCSEGQHEPRGQIVRLVTSTQARHKFC